MQVELARQHQQHQQRSHSNSNHYMNVSLPYSVPQSTTSNYHLVSDLNGNNGNNAESTDIHSDSASSSAASSFVHLPLAGVGANTGVDSLSVGSLLVGGGYDNVSFFSFLGAHFFPHWDHLLSFMEPRKSLVCCAPWKEKGWMTVGRSRAKISSFLVNVIFFPTVTDFFFCSCRIPFSILIEGVRRRHRHLRHHIIIHTTRMAFRLTNTTTNITNNNLIRILTIINNISHNNKLSQTLVDQSSLLRLDYCHLMILML